MKKLIVISLTIIMCLSVMAITAWAAPEGLNSLAIVGSGVPGVSNWFPGDPNGDMVEVSESVFTKTVTFSTAGSMEFKVAGNDDWVHQWNFGAETQGEKILVGQRRDLVQGNSSGNMILEIDEGGDYLITVDLRPLAQGDAATILVEQLYSTVLPEEPGEPTQPTQPIDGEKITITIEVPQDWTTVYVYTWDPWSFGEYPGYALPMKSDHTYECDLDVNLTNLIISNQDGLKTDDLILRPGRTKSIKVDSDGRATIKERGIFDPSPPVYPQSNYRVVGNAEWMGNWDAAFEGGRMYDMGNGVYRKCFENVPVGNYEFKITKDGKWDGAYGVDGMNFCFTVEEQCNVIVDFQLKDGVGIIDVYGPPIIWDEDEEENPKSADVSILLPTLMLLSSAVSLPMVLSRRMDNE